VEHRTLGRSGLSISEIIYGNWLTHGEGVERDAATACVRTALDVGITTFDTADVYAQGAAEEVLGHALKGERRASLEIATKVCLPTGPGHNDRGLSRKHITESCHASLRRLGTDYIDLYQAHRFDDDTPLTETLIAFDDLVRAGKVLYLGVSEWRADQIAAALRLAEDLGLRSRIIANQPQYNMLWRVIESEVLPLCEREGIGQIVFQPLAQGVLTGKYLPGRPAPTDSRATATGRATHFISRVLGDTLLERVQDLEPIAADAGLTMAQLAVAWTLNQPGVTSAIIAATRPEQVRDNAGASGVRLDAQTLKRIDEVLGNLVDRDAAKTGQMMNVKPEWRASAG
jgi:aryl-alcohol dehydrogenase-like predicted oxidoreductase